MRFVGSSRGTVRALHTPASPRSPPQTRFVAVLARPRRRPPGIDSALLGAAGVLSLLLLGAYFQVRVFAYPCAFSQMLCGCPCGARTPAQP